MRVHINLIQIRTEYFVAQLFHFTDCKRNVRLKLQGRVVFLTRNLLHIINDKAMNCTTLDQQLISRHL